ncbi:MAG TPA: hypothetical protein VHZ78_08750 [Rhizomicrobium sp.]|jgi:hypothetical protein|nr:hypothetical protein [Rhizomicrobium sp.]
MSAAVKVRQGRSPARNRRRTEQDFQIALVRLLDMILTPATRFFHVPNGGYRTRAEAGILKAMGIKPGMHDVVFLHRLQFGDAIVCAAYGLELKTNDCDLDDNQIQAHADLATIGMPSAVARNIDEAIAHIRSWGIPLRMKDTRVELAA